MWGIFAYASYKFLKSISQRINLTRSNIIQIQYRNNDLQLAAQQLTKLSKRHFGSWIQHHHKKLHHRNDQKWIKDGFTERFHASGDSKYMISRAHGFHANISSRPHFTIFSYLFISVGYSTNDEIQWTWLIRRNLPVLCVIWPCFRTCKRQ